MKNYFYSFIEIFYYLFKLFKKINKKGIIVTLYIKSVFGLRVNYIRIRSMKIYSQFLPPNQTYPKS